jgi:hypothetical protein
MRMMDMKPDSGMRPGTMNPAKESGMEQAPAMQRRPPMGTSSR